MKDSKPLFTFKLLVTLCILVLVVCLAADALAEIYEVRIVQASGGLNVRKEPALDARAVYLLGDCETVLVLEWRDGWALVAKNTNRSGLPLGWVCGDYLR